MDFDVVVVGAGPAGATAASYLADQNLHVLLLEKHLHPREKPCGGGLSTRVWKQFPYVEPLLDSICYGATIHSPSKYAVTINRKQPLLGMIRRTTFDQALVQRAQEKGVEVRQETEVVNIFRKKKGLSVVADNNDTISTNLILGCDGMRSIVADKLGLNKKHRSFGLCVYKEHPIADSDITNVYSSDHIGHIFIKTQEVSGFGWVFPKKDSVNIGLGEFVPNTEQRKPKNHLQKRYNDFLDMLQRQHLLPKKCTGENAKGALLPLFPLSRTFDDNVMICGDAAGLINPISGEGIFYAMSSGELAAITAHEALQQHDTSSRFLSRYQDRWMKAFGQDILKLQKYNKTWDNPHENIMRYISQDPTLAKLLIGVVGGRLSFSRYKPVVGLRYGYVKLKDMLLPHKEKKVEL